MKYITRRSLLLLPAVLLAGIATPAAAQTLNGQDLMDALKKGGHVIVMRHAASPREVPTAAEANPDNPNRERQLDAEGQRTATGMGEAFRRLEIPVGQVISSPTYRAQETVRYAQLGEPDLRPELGNDPEGMQGGTEAQAEWLRQRVGQFSDGTNVLIVTHMPNVRGAFPEFAEGLADGEALIFGPDGSGAAQLIARVKIEQWPEF